MGYDWMHNYYPQNRRNNPQGDAKGPIQRRRFRICWKSRQVGLCRKMTMPGHSTGPMPTITIASMTYNHTQHGRWHYILFAFTAATLVGTWLASSVPPVEIILLVTAAIFAVCGLVFGSLTISDEGDRLAICFGPLPLIRKTIRYDAITSVEIGRTSIIDGWGMHYLPGHGWTYNIWGFSCVKLTLGRKIIRVGTDDAEGLAKFLHERTGISGKSE